jgi:hypothetical protein
VSSRAVRLVAFWTSVGVVGGVLTPFALELAASKFPNSGFAKFIAYTHKGVQ